MPDLQAFQRALHTPEWWQQEMAAANDTLAPYLGLQPEDLTPENTHQLFSAVIQELGRQAIILRALALEDAPKKRGRPPKGEPEPRREIPVNTNGEKVELMRMKLTANEARDLAERLYQAADEIEGNAQLELDDGME